MAMRYFSLENAAQAIGQPETRGLFGEVLSSFHNDNYRSASVMLWTVVVVDLVFKVKELVDVYQDTTAQAVLTEIQQLQASNQKDPAWEGKLVELMETKLALLTPVERQAVDDIQKHRHLSAHPILSQHDILYQPSRELVLADIRTAVEYVLSRPAVLSKNVFNEMLEDIESVKNTLGSDSALNVYLSSRYFSRLPNPVRKKVFKSLWRVAYCTRDERADANRHANSVAVRALYEEDPVFMADVVRGERSYFSDRLLPSSECSEYVELMADYVTLYELLTDAARARLDAELDADLALDFIALFRSGTVVDHIEHAKQRIDALARKCESVAIPSVRVLSFNSHAKAAGCDEAFRKFCVDCYVNSNHYDMADNMYESLISPMLDYFTMSEVLDILQRGNQNSQVYDRRRCESASREVLAVARRFDSSIQATAYPNLF